MEGELIWIGLNLQYQVFQKTHQKISCLAQERCTRILSIRLKRAQWTGTILGATNGGNKLSIKPEVTNIDVDGVLVEAKGLMQKTGETAQIETNMVEVTKDFLQSTVIGQDGVSEDTRFDVIESKALIDDDDYIENFAFVGFKTDGSPIIVLFDYAICTEGLELDNKNKEAAVIPATFKCVADLVAGGNTNKLPYHIYVPKSE